MKIRHPALLALFLIHPSAFAAEPACHELLTPQECSSHLEKLALLPAGVEREHYLLEFARTRKERESACACATLSYRQAAQQVAMKY